MKKGKGKKNKNCSLYKSETNFYKMWCGLKWCVGRCWEKYNIYKKRHMYLSMISRYIFHLL